MTNANYFYQVEEFIDGQWQAVSFSGLQNQFTSYEAGWIRLKQMYPERAEQLEKNATAQNVGVRVQRVTKGNYLA